MGKLEVANADSSCLWGKKREGGLPDKYVLDLLPPYCSQDKCHTGDTQSMTISLLKFPVSGWVPGLESQSSTNSF